MLSIESVQIWAIAPPNAANRGQLPPCLLAKTRAIARVVGATGLGTGRVQCTGCAAMYRSRERIQEAKEASLNTAQQQAEIADANARTAEIEKRMAEISVLNS